VPSTFVPLVDEPVHTPSVDADTRPELPPVTPSVAQQPGAGVGPAFSDDVNTGKDSDEHPGSALERELEGR
jgi:hypothetical protein